MEYRETQSSWWLTAALMVSVVGSGVGTGYAAWTEESLVAWIAWIACGVLTIFLLAVFFCFARLRITINADGMRAAFGPFSKSVPWADVKDVEASRYKWLQFGGWGWRGDLKGAVAFSMPGFKDQLVFHLNNGKRVHVTIKNAPAAMEAVNEHRP